ncbi:MAG: TonB-dependent receptor [Acidobacteriota bacterium]
MSTLFQRLTALVFVLAAASGAFAQSDTATVIGTITDAQGAVLPGATVTATNTRTGFTRSAVSDETGRYRLAALPPGPYELMAELQGFSTQRRSGVTLALGSESVLNFELPLGTVTEAVTVTAEVPVVQTTTSAVEARLDRATLDILPLIGRDYTSLLRLVPGAQSSNGTSFTGSRGRSNQWNIDGISNSEDISGYSRQDLALDSIQEVQVLVNGFKAEFGSASGGVVNVVTRSGSNDLRGSGFFLFRDQSLMARSPYADRSLPEDPFQRIHYGGWLGGPIRRDRAHYFVNYEREDRDTNTSSTRTLPAANSNWAPSTLQFLAANNIPLSLFGAGGRVRQVRPEFVNVHNITAKIDSQLSNNQALTMRYQMTHDTQPSGQGGTIFDFNGSRAFFRTNYVNFNHKWVLAGNKLNEAYIQVGQSFGDWRADYPGLTNLTITGGFDLGGPTNYPQGRTDYVYQFKNTFSWQLTNTRTGEHALKMGAEYKLFDSDGFFDSNWRGLYTFPSLNAFINGTPSRFTQNQGNSSLARPNTILGFFIQDDWRPNASLTLNFGLRYDWEGATTEALVDVTGKAGPGISNDKNNFSPRFGFSWAPGASTKHAIYGGTGIYYDQIILNIIGNARFTPPKVIGIQIDNPTWPNPFAGGTVRLPPPSLSVIDENLRTGYNWNSQIGYRRELARDLGIDVSYVHNRGYDQVGITNTNLGQPGTANINGGGAVRPDPQYTNVNFYSNWGEIRYHGLLVDVHKRFSNNFQSGVNYTLSKTRDNAFNFVSTLIYPTNPELNWGPGTDDRRHRISANSEVRLPWNLTAGIIAEFRTEAPLNITAARDINGDGSTGEWVNEKVCRTIACPGFNYSRNSVYQISTEEANRLRALFGLSPIAEFEDNPKYFNVDLTLQWALPFNDRRRARISAEAFNLLNRPLRNLPTESITSGTFGQRTSVSQPRAIQFTLQVDF